MAFRMKKLLYILVAAILVTAGGVYYFNSSGGENAPEGKSAPPIGAKEPTPENVAAVDLPKRQPGALTDPLPQGVARVEGGPLIASVLVNTQRTPDLSPNQVGEFPRVYVKPGQTVSIRLRFPSAQPGAKAGVSVEDGGYVADKRPAIPLVLDERLEGEFDFTAGTEPGRYRVVVRQGGDTRTLVLWAEA
jgi:hypothetical protein